MLSAIRTTSGFSRRSIVKFFGLAPLAVLIFVSSAIAEGPKEQLQGTIDSIIKVLKTIRSRADIDKNRSSIRQILLSRFDFEAMAQQSLGNRWNDLNGDRQEFVSVFTDFLENGYMSTLGSYRGESVVYDEDRVHGDAAEVDTRVVGGEGAPLKIGYKLHLIGEQWMVYDAVIDDVSVVGNYHSQFARIIHKASLEKLIEDLRARASSR